MCIRDRFNRGFITDVGGDWNGNLDAFNDYLGWADGRCTIRWLNSTKSRADLGHAAMAAWLSNKMADSSPPHDPDWQQRLSNASDGVGQTFFDWIVEIVHQNSDYVDLELA